MTAEVPPGSFVKHSTVIFAIILIFGWKGMTTMTRKRITGSSWKKIQKDIKIFDNGCIAQVNTDSACKYKRQLLDIPAWSVRPNNFTELAKFQSQQIIREI